ncbi:MAG: hypothetical protein K0R65_821 [Crocinitomicaceae bacterium]|jgi:flagellar assembly factor FliW|nr:hypothetical protein [Crocinitomicaceae bacterium]
MENLKEQLCIEISDAFCALSKISGGKLHVLGSLLFREKKDFQLKEALAGFLKEKAGELSAYEEVSVSWVSANAMLVPSAVFEPKSMEALFATCFTKQVTATELDYNRISELSIVNLYEIPLWVKSFFVIKFPRALIQHEYSHQLRGIMKQAFRLQVQVNVYPGQMTIQAADKNELLFCNAFEIQHVNDVVYYLTFALQQMQLAGKAGKLNFHLQADAIAGKEELSAILKQIDTFKSMEITFDSEKTIKYQELCV